MNILEKLKLELKNIESLSMDIYRDEWVKGHWSSDNKAQEFYSCQKKALIIKDKIFDIESKTKKISITGKSQLAIDMEEKRAIKESNVTSSTHERAKKRLFKDSDGFISGKSY
jgi:hypothetical protein